MSDQNENNIVPTKTTPVNDQAEIDTAPIIEEVTKEVTEKVSAEAARQAAEKATAEVTQKIVESIQGKKQEAKTPWAKEGRTPKSYDEIYEVSKKDAVKEVLTELEKKNEETAKKTDEQKKVEAKKTEEQNKYWDKQIEQLVNEGYLTKPSDEVQKKLDRKEKLNTDDMQDSGIKQRIELWEHARQNNEPNLRLVYFEHMKNKKAEPGTQAPVIGASRGGPSNDAEDFSWEEIHKTPLHDLIK